MSLGKSMLNFEGFQNDEPPGKHNPDSVKDFV